MSDDEDVYVKRTKTIHYGSLEDAEKVRILDNNEGSHTEERAPNPPQIPASTGEYFKTFNYFN